MIQLVETGLATWRISHMLVYEAGPFDMFVKMRKHFGIEHDDSDIPIAWPHGVVFQCVWCLSVWIAGLVMLMPRRITRLFAVAALSAMVETVMNSGIRDN